MRKESREDESDPGEGEREGGIQRQTRERPEGRREGERDSQREREREIIGGWIRASVFLSNLLL